MDDSTESILDKKNSIDFENTFDYKPLKKGFFESLNEKIFRVMSRKKKVVAPLPQKKPEQPDVFPAGKDPFDTKPESTPAFDPEKSVKRKLFEQAAAIEKSKSSPHQYLDGVMHPGANEIVIPHKLRDTISDADLKFLAEDEPKKKSRLASINKINVVINTFAMVGFAIGAFVVYSELPTRPELIAGICLLAGSAGVIANGR